MGAAPGPGPVADRNRRHGGLGPDTRPGRDPVTRPTPPAARTPATAAPLARLATVVTVLLPIVLMLIRAVVELTIDDPNNGLQKVTDVLGNPSVALLIG